MKEALLTLVRTSLERCYKAGTLTSGAYPDFVIEKPANIDHGDFAVNVAMQLAKAERKAPRAVAQALVEQLQQSDICQKVEIAGPGFINFFLKDEAWQQTLLAIDRAGADYGKSSVGAGKRVQVEFVSANPTGPLHIGHGRGAALGDT